MTRAAFAEILSLLVDHEVEFIVVGMTAAVLHGAPVTTIDLDIVHRRTADNVSRLLRALAELDATYRHDPRRLRPTESHLVSAGHQLLTTRLGDLDCLGTIDDGRGYDDLFGMTVELKLEDGKTIRVLSLPALIDAKQRSGRPKDVAVLPVLRATLDETNRRG
jgi:hypothetical protein